ncbi:MAG TPA: glycoside hydrolase family 15 protein [Ohtaekwangia sp.]|nr:glycoside hydrolase family 15 protein [Ohtaekwangia sp.]
MEKPEDYQPIENYGVIGDLNTVALVGLNGSIDFLCFPDFDSPTVFAAILDKNKGGFFSIKPKTTGFKSKQLYLPDTNVLLTRFLQQNGVAEITDFMPVETMLIGKELIRSVSCVHGTLDFIMTCCPRFDYARTTHTIQRKNENEILFISQGQDKTVLRLLSSIPLVIEENNVLASFSLQTAEKVTFMLEYVTSPEPGEFDLQTFAEKSLFETINYWKDWIDKSQYQGRWMEIVNRSALVLKLMTSQKYGSIVAAPTFGLPEEIGGIRNWDYRYTWIRDASFTVYTLLKLGYKKETREFINWVEKQCNGIGDAGSLRLMYTIDGRKDLFESSLEHLEGYRNSKPVRIGNGAYDQVQLDIYGELLDAVYLYDKYGEPISYNFWLDVSRQVNWVCDHWETEDEGIWEVRGGKKQFLYSRMMCWVAIDRATKIADAHSYPLNPRWRDERDKIFNSIHNDFWNEELQCFVQYKGAKTVDAATLLMPLVRFIGPKDPRWLSTLNKIEEKLVSDFLVYRYRPDESLEGLTGGEGTFSMCTFWYVECLAKSGQLNKARLYFEKMVGYANHLGLYAEQLGLQGEHLGNFPQAFTHLGLISAALSLNSQFNDQRNKEEFI